MDGPKFFGAHFRVVGGRLVAFNFSEAGLDAAITVWEFDDAFKCARARLRCGDTGGGGRSCEEGRSQPAAVPAHYGSAPDSA